MPDDLELPSPYRSPRWRCGLYLRVDSVGGVLSVRSLPVNGWLCEDLHPVLPTPLPVPRKYSSHRVPSSSPRLLGFLWAAALHCPPLGDSSLLPGFPACLPSARGSQHLSQSFCFLISFEGNPPISSPHCHSSLYGAFPFVTIADRSVFIPSTFNVVPNTPVTVRPLPTEAHAGDRGVFYGTPHSGGRVRLACTSLITKRDSPPPSPVQSHTYFLSL